MLYELERKKMSILVENIYNRWLTNAAGGNLSIKVSDEHYIMTPSLMSVKELWVCNPESILVVDKDLNIIEGNGTITREINMHMAIYENDPRAKAVIHAHPKELMVYACLGKDMPFKTEAATEMGSFLPCLKYGPATTKELANIVGKHAKEQYESESHDTYGALLNKHGIILASHDIFFANDMLERLETDAYVNTVSRLLEK